MYYNIDNYIFKRSNNSELGIAVKINIFGKYLLSKIGQHHTVKTFLDIFWIIINLYRLIGYNTQLPSTIWRLTRKPFYKDIPTDTD